MCSLGPQQLFMLFLHVKLQCKGEVMARKRVNCIFNVYMSTQIIISS